MVSIQREMLERALVNCDRVLETLQLELDREKESEDGKTVQEPE
jgi:hypothetical protein